MKFEQLIYLAVGYVVIFAMTFKVVQLLFTLPLAYITTKYILSHDLNFCEGNIIKYITRYKLKNGLEDLYKAKKYLELLIDDVKND